MELRTIETFLKVAELKSFSRAAKKLGYSQSAVTMQVQQLERELGARLFDRVPRGALLTDQGRAFALRAREVLDAAARAAASVAADADQLPELVRGTLRIGSAESISTALLPELIVRFHRLYPRVEVVVRTARREQLIDGLRDGSLDVVLTMENKFSAAGLSRTLLRQEEIVFVAPARDVRAPGWGSAPAGGIGARPEAPAGEKDGSYGARAVAGSPAPSGAPARPAEEGALARPLGLADLPQLPFVLTERGESYRFELDRLLAEADQELVPLVEAGNTETLVHLAERGVGCSFLPRFSVEASLAAGTLELLPVDAPPVRMWSQLFVRKSTWMSAPLQAFIDLAGELIA